MRLKIHYFYQKIAIFDPQNVYILPKKMIFHHEGGKYLYEKWQFLGEKLQIFGSEMLTSPKINHF